MKRDLYAEVSARIVAELLGTPGRPGLISAARMASSLAFGSRWTPKLRSRSPCPRQARADRFLDWPTMTWRSDRSMRLQAAKRPPFGAR
jgi:hypothetical protein